MMWFIIIRRRSCIFIVYMIIQSDRAQTEIASVILPRAFPDHTSSLFEGVLLKHRDMG